MERSTPSLGKRIRRELSIWRFGALPGLLVIALITGARLTGNLQFLERVAFDALLKLRPPEPTDQRILIVGIDEADLQKIGQYPLPDATLAELIEQLEKDQPRVIGLDIYRDLAVEPGHAELVAVLKRYPNLIGIERILPESGLPAPPPAALPAERVGFADAVIDSDGNLRRSLLSTWDRSGQHYKYSLTFRVSAAYLAKAGISPTNGIRDPEAVRFRAVEFNRVLPNTGGYVNADARGNQILINFRSGKQPFRIVPLQAIFENRIPREWIHDQIVLIGVTAASIKDVVNTGAVSSSSSGLLTGIEIQAHTISQITSAVLDGRPLLHTWGEAWEYVWIIVWGIIGISLGRFLLSPFKILAGLGITTLLLISLCYGLLLLGWWVPIVPATLVLVLNGAGLTAFMFYRRERDLQAKIQERQFIIDYTYDAIHNGPLQSLAHLLRQVQSQSLASDQLYLALQNLNQELRTVYESVRQETLSQANSLHLGSGLKVDLQHPTQELLYEVFNDTLGRDFPYFRTIKLRIPVFEAIDDRFLTLEHKRGLCRFLEEALCNVGKHAVGATRLEVVCKQEGNSNLIRITDNGQSPALESDSVAGRGTQQAKNLERQLRGQFRRYANQPQGTVCELSWSAAKLRFWRF